MSDYQKDYINQLLDKFRMNLSDKSKKSLSSYNKAISNLEHFSTIHHDEFAFPSQEFLADWFLHMRAQGLSFKTATYYFDIIAALFRDIEALSHENYNELFKSFKREINSLYKNKDNISFAFNAGTLKSFRNILRNISNFKDTDSIVADMILYSLLNLGINLRDIAIIKTSDVSISDLETEALVKRQSSPRRRYLFNLNQSKLTEKQLSIFVDRTVSDFLRVRNIPVIKSADNTIRLLWAYVAMSLGISGSEILAVLGSAPDGIAELNMCSPLGMASKRIESIGKTVISSLVENPLRWYAVRLRPRVDFHELTTRVSRLESEIKRPEFFYPYDEIAKKTGKKLVFDRQPVIKDIVFLKMRVTEIFPLFSQIGDIAWCYTTSGKPGGGDYAAIPQKSFTRFQETIGHFTPEYEVAPIGGFEPSERETVIILNGPLANYEFEVEKPKDTDNVIFQLNMIGDNGFQWRTSAKKHQFLHANQK